MNRNFIYFTGIYSRYKIKYMIDCLSQLRIFFFLNWAPSISKHKLFSMSIYTVISGRLLDLERLGRLVDKNLT